MIEFVKDLGLRDLGTYKKRFSLVKCDCGKEFETRFADYKKGKVLRCKSCAIVKRNHKHGEHKSKLYNSWCHIVSRTESDTYHATSRYKGRGISMCSEWRNDYIVFRDWALVNGWKEGLTIDRIDNDGNYEPSNCQWLTKSENSKKRWEDAR